MNPNLLFLVGAVVLAVLGSVLVRLVTRPRTRPIGANEVQQALRNMSRHRPRRVHGTDGVRLIGRDESTDGPTTGVS